MSVLIKGMEMPKSCYDCPLQDEECFGSIKCCYAKTWGSANMRAVDCPLVSVPEHGRLGDLDELEKSFREDADAECNRFDVLVSWADAFDYVANIVADAPTIIPAEPPKEDDNE